MPMETTAEYSRFRSMGKQGHRRKGKETKGKERHRRKGQRIREKGTGSPTGHKHVAIVGKTTHRIPMETNAEYSRFRSMGKQGIEEKERKGTS